MNATATPLNLLPNPSEALVRAYQTIADTRMKGLDFLNPVIQTEAIGFREWNGCWLGILLTPWTMNLLLTPHDPTKWPQAATGTTVTHHFPYGTYSFIVAHEALLGADIAGDYMMCALFSPVQQFTDHETAHETAVQVLNLLFEPDAETEAARQLEAAEKPDLQTRLNAPLSKRDFLRGAFLRRGQS